MNRQKRGKGVLTDLYKLGVKVFTGENVSKRNPLAVAELNENFGLRDPRIVKMSAYAGPATLLQQQLRHQANPVNRVDLISQLHDINYQLAKKKEDIRKADQTMVSQLGSSLAQDVSIWHPLRTLENIVSHPIRTTANVINKGAALLAIEGKQLAEDAGLVSQYGLTPKKNSAKFEKLLLKKRE